MNAVALVAMTGGVALLIAAAVGYLTRVRMTRPPVGVYTWGDTAFMCVAVVVVPLVYLALPSWVVVVVFGLVLCTAVQFTLAPVVGGRTAWLVALAGAAATGATAGRPLPVMIATDVLLVVAVVGVANVWVQSGMRAAHVAFFAGGLACYDVIATTLTSVMSRFATQVQDLPFAPALALTRGEHPVSLGLGDVLMLVLYPLVSAKAFGRAAALVAAGVGLAVTGVVSVLFARDVLTAGFPLLTALGPLIVAQYVYWRRATGGERSVARWRSGDPVRTAAEARITPDPLVGQALDVPVPEDVPEGHWIAIEAGEVVGTGPTAGLARRAAAGRGSPLVRQV
ncbi:hypothetical protein [Embleya sp. AB8]|uniref:hypothetical protein n=1 Tax=Embleya sp. AB8 TaxID=3156304 RepID=UPI003C77E88E